MQTGIKKLDDILGGGIKSGIITDVFGASSTGKTQLTLQIMANALQDGKRIFYQDTNGSSGLKDYWRCLWHEIWTPVFLTMLL